MTDKTPADEGCLWLIVGLATLGIIAAIAVSALR